MRPAMLKPLLGLALSAALPLHAAFTVTHFSPSGAPIGTNTTLTLAGKDLQHAREVFFVSPHIKGTITQQPSKKDAEKKGKPKPANTLDVTVDIAPDCPPGAYPFRVRSVSTLSDMFLLYVSPWPNTLEEEPNSIVADAQAISQNTVVNGVIKKEDVDIFAVDAKKGQRLTLEVEGMRLSRKLFDPSISIQNEDRFVLAASDDTILLKQDPSMSLIIPKDGRYFIKVRESSYGGTDSAHYRLHVGDAPRPYTVFPLGGPTGQALPLTLLGDPTGPISLTPTLPSAPQSRFPIRVQGKHASAPSPNWIRVSDFPNTLEIEPNGGRTTATPSTTPPLALNGVISKERDEDWFRFEAKKGRNYHVNVFARQLRSPLDAILDLFDEKGKRLGGKDDDDGPDPYYRFKPSADGTYFVRIRDHLRSGSPAHGYRVEIEAVAPSLAINLPPTKQNTQNGQALTLSPGNRTAAVFTLSRKECKGAVNIDFPNLPAGITAFADPATKDAEKLAVVFEASTNATLGTHTLTPVASLTNKSGIVSGRLEQGITLVYGNPNNRSYHARVMSDLIIAVVDPAPYDIQMTTPPTPLVRYGQLTFTVRANRQEGFTAPIRCDLQLRPAGVSGPTQVTIPKDKDQVTFNLTANGSAPLGKWKLIVLGSATHKGEPYFCASTPTEYTIAPPYLTGTIDMAAAPQGDTIEINCALSQHVAFDGNATVTLYGLPANATTQNAQITCKDERLSFEVIVATNTPIGEHKSLFLNVSVKENGNPIIHNIAGGGVLRVDAPPKNAPSKKVAQGKKNGKAKDTAKPTSQLDRLRAAQKERRGQMKADKS